MPPSLASPLAGVHLSADGLCPPPNPLRLFAAPLLLPAQLFDEVLCAAAVELAEQAVRRAGFVLAGGRVPELLCRALPSAFAAAPPPFVIVDFALGGDASSPSLHLLELQAFPSVLMTVHELAVWQRRHFRLDHARSTPPGVALAEVFTLFRDTILDGHDPGQVALVEVRPAHQRNAPDLLAHQRLLGVQVEDLADLALVGGDCVRSRRTGRSYRRIYNRVLWHEAEAHGLAGALAEFAAADLSWANHPAWYHAVSKASLPYLSHPTAPPALYADDPATAALDLRDWVLKPLFSCGGRGVERRIDRAALARLPGAERHVALLQRRITYTPLLDTPAGPRHVELRALLLWPPAAPRPRVGMCYFRANEVPIHALSAMSGLYNGSGVAYAAHGAGAGG